MGEEKYSVRKGVGKGAVEGGSAVVVLAGLITVLNALGADIDPEAAAALVASASTVIAVWRFLRNFLKQVKEGRV